MVGMRTSMAMARGSCRKREGSSGVGGHTSACRGARPYGDSALSTDGAVQPAQVDVQPRHEQRARRLVAHVEKNHALIVSIPCPVLGRRSHTSDRFHPEYEISTTPPP